MGSSSIDLQSLTIPVAWMESHHQRCIIHENLVAKREYTEPSFDQHTATVPH